MEIWKKSPLSPEFIEVSNTGRARSTARKTVGIRMGIENIQIRPAKIFAPWIAENGYFSIAVQIGQKRKKYLLHRLIASAFCNGFDPNLSVNHINGNKLDNYPSNLEWVTLSKNTTLQWETGLVNLRGENHPLHKLKTNDVIEIKKLLELNVRVIEIANKFNVSNALIYKIKSGKKKHWIV